MTTTMIDYKAQQAARASAAAAMQAANPHLLPVGGKLDSLQAAAKNIRIELARAFPGVKFSVKSRRFSGGDAIDVRWTDGPVSAQVDEIIGKYSAGSFDGITDCYDYKRSAWTDAFGDAKYIHAGRSNSDRAIASAIRRVFAVGYEELVGVPVPTVAEHQYGATRAIRVCGGQFLDDLIWRAAARMTWAITRKVPA